MTVSNVEVFCHTLCEESVSYWTVSTPRLTCQYLIFSAHIYWIQSLKSYSMFSQIQATLVIKSPRSSLRLQRSSDRWNKLFRVQKQIKNYWWNKVVYCCFENWTPFNPRVWAFSPSMRRIWAWDRPKIKPSREFLIRGRLGQRLFVPPRTCADVNAQKNKTE